MSADPMNRAYFTRSELAVLEQLAEDRLEKLKKPTKAAERRPDLLTIERETLCGAIDVIGTLQAMAS